jgi:formylglycine-generating enzyme required for sulfatase activity
LVEGQNSAAVDLFPIRHAEKVLAAFGRAFGVLPDSAAAASKEQKQFLEQAVSGLAQEGKIVCVRLALFAEMMKGKLWTPATLKEVGGTEGVGVTFLEETFSAATAPPEHRYHQKAAQAVLKALLPEAATDIRGHLRSQQELLEASAYTNRPRDFDELLDILDSELRLLTPADPEGKQEGSVSSLPPGAKYYQLTHDYLVPSLRDWLTRKQKETRRGRAELLLADRASVWNGRPENRQLPSLPQWGNIWFSTRKKNWTEPQRKMMRKATRYHAARGTVLAVSLVLLALVGLEGFGKLKAHGFQDRLLNADITEVPTIVKDMEPYRRWVHPLLQDAHVEAENEHDARKLLRLSLALLPVDSNQFDYLYERLLTAGPEELRVIRDTLKGQQAVLVERLRNVVGSAEEDPQRRLRAACALAGCDGAQEAVANGCWQAASSLIANQLLAAVQKNPSHYPLLLDLLRPARTGLLAPLAEVYRAKERPEKERSFATNILVEYAAEQPDFLANLLMDGDADQFAVIFPKLREQAERGLPLLIAEIDRTCPAAVPSSDDRRERLAKRQANAAVALLKLNQPGKVWPLLKHSSDPRSRSYLIHRLCPLGADAGAIIKRLDEEADVTICRALLLSLGEYGEKEVSPEARKAVLPKVQDMYRTATDPGLHASAEWLLRTWQQEAWLEQVNDEWAKDKGQRQKRLQGIKQFLTKDKEKTPPQWYVNSQGQTMVVIPGPVEFVMGSPSTEEGRNPNELQHKKRIGRTFALAAKTVTVEQYRKFDARYGIDEIELWARTADSPVIFTSWFQAAAYCNWLSKQEDIPEDQWCYEPNSQGQVTKLKENYLSLTGYRLPTEAEIEYATRAGAATSRYFGETEDLLEKYAWYRKNSQGRTWPVGSKKPNDLGLFDLHGNVWNWCQEKLMDYPQGQGEKGTEDKEDTLIINPQDRRVERGASYINQASLVRSAGRLSYGPTNRHGGEGFRPARTFTP